MFFKNKIIVSDYVMDQFHSLNHIHDIHDLVVCYTAIATHDQDTVIHASHLIYDYLSPQSIPEMIIICENFKQCTSIDWKNIDITSFERFFSDKKAYLYLLILGTYHPNGYYRQKCLTHLINYPGTLPFVLLRLNDWVAIIKKLSYQYSLNKIKDCSLNELLSSLFIIDKIQNSHRRDNDDFEKIKVELLNQIKLQTNSTLHENIQLFHLKARKSIYKFILPLDILNKEKCLSYEKNSFCQLLIIRSILQNTNLTDEHLRLYLNHKSSYIRKQALYYQYQRIQKPWDGLDEFLLDSCASIRDFTRFILRKHTQIDILAFYQNSLPHLYAIYGIGECGQESDSQYILPYLEHENPRYISASLWSLSHLLKDKGKDIYWKYLFHESPSVSKQAFLAIKNNKLKFKAKTIYHQYINENNTQHIKLYLFKLLFNENAWDRLPYLLMLYPSHNEDLIKKAIENRHLYYVLSQEESKFIQKILSDKKKIIPKKIIDSILFDLKYVTKKIPK